MNCAWVFLCSLFYLAAVEYREVNGFAFDDLDFARSAIEAVAKSIPSRPKFAMIPVSVTDSKSHSFRKRPSFMRPKAKPDVFSSASVEKTSSSVPSYVPSFSLSGLSPVSSESLVVFETPKTRTRLSKKPRNLNKFNEAMDQVERAMAQAELSRKTAKLTDLKKDIMDAVNRGNIRFARRALGIALYTVRKESKRSRKRSPGYDAKTFLNDIKTDLGYDKFSDFLALHGEVTLMFALDVTGSMHDEIKASKEMIKKISQYDRSEPVDYILTTFSDPVGLTDTKAYAEDEVNKLIKHLHTKTASGGGDCSEYSYDGMMSSLYEDPREGSPLYVFTDAPPKDADGDNKETLSVLAKDFEVTINFFAGKTFCGTEAQQQPYKEVVEAYGGQYLKLHSNELVKMASFVDSSLEGDTRAVSGKSKSGRRKRRATTNIGIPVDDTVTKLVVTVTTESSPRSIQLYTPTGRVQTSGKTVLSRVIVFSVNNPLKGLWKLVVPSSIGKFEYQAKVISPESIDFKHYFNKVERGKMVQLRNPLAGQSVKVSLTVSGASKIQKSSLLVDIIDVVGNTLMANKKPTEVGKSGIRFTFDLVPPNKAFKLMLKGKTNAGKKFQRISRHVDSSKPLVVKEYYTFRHYTISQKGSTTVLFYLFNGLSSEKSYHVSFKTKKGYIASLHGSQSRASRMKVRGGRKKYIRVSVRYNGGTPAKLGETLNVIIIVKGRDKSFVTTEVVPLMII